MIQETQRKTNSCSFEYDIGSHWCSLLTDTESNTTCNLDNGQAYENEKMCRELTVNRIKLPALYLRGIRYIMNEWSEYYFGVFAQ